ncbi:carbohydrate ABC transporter permease [Arthrobacter crusticola]|uniref:Carbohydrate ABC transporter permease n=1 Tax=Arthrobacter crusticola TaxID=2547960 RepID=A0A4R5TT25_9MICC|nr:carbohydrate ABC transporter permease [Arthrobacter crusticola]TDK23962.1 carbohydrate ABC transporter permease [Arthrobacter crusticola]
MTATAQHPVDQNLKRTVRTTAVRPMRTRRSRSATTALQKTIAYLLLSLAGLLSIGPFVWVGLASLKRPVDAFSLPPVWDFTPTLQAYQILWNDRGFGHFLLNTLLVGVLTTVISLLVAAPAAYALSRFRHVSGLWILLAALVFRALPRMAVVLPFYYLARLTGLYDTQVLLIAVLVAVNQPFTIWLLRDFFAGIPEELEESAMVDGCSRIQAFRRIILPVAGPGLVTAAVFTFLLAYQEYMIPLVLTQTSAVTLPVFIAQFSTENIQDWPVISAAAVSLALPIVGLVMLAQRFLVAGLTAGSTKG